MQKLMIILRIVVGIGIFYVFGLGLLQFLNQIDESAVAAILLIVWWSALWELLNVTRRAS